MTRFVHKESGQVVRGVRVRVGKFLRKDDVFESSTGNWEKCPCPGTRLVSTHVTWVRERDKKH